MNTTRNLLSAAVLIAALALCTLPAPAQLNNFGESTALVLDAPRLISGGASSLTTNEWVDTHGMAGIATITFFSATNTVGTLTATLEASNDKTTPITFGSYARATSTDVIYTNLYYGTNGLTCTNTYLLPGVVTTPTAATAGFATPYILPALYTNTGAVTGLGIRGITRIAYPVQDAPRYLRVIWTTGGTTTNLTCGALLTARKQNFP